MAMPAAEERDQPVTLHRVMQTMIGDGLRSHYEAPRRLSHQLFVLMMQLNEDERKREPPKRTRRRHRGSA